MVISQSVTEMPETETNRQILSIAREILGSEGLGAVSFDAIARRLGRSKQAVLYWYPTKHDLLAAMFLPWLEAEAETATYAVSMCSGRSEAVNTFVRSVAGFHLADLDRFRMMYLVPQTTTAKSPDRGKLVAGDKVYPVTNRLYGALANHLGGGPDAARKEAVVIHSAVLGLVMMIAFADALRDPLKHNPDDLILSLIDAFAAG